MRSTPVPADGNGLAIAPDVIAEALGRALEVWSDQRDARGLRRALLAVLAKLDEAS